MEKGTFAQEFVAGNVSGLVGMTVVVSKKHSICNLNAVIMFGL